jgi:hypothetical protein
MPKNVMKKRIEALSRMSPEEIEKALPQIMDEARAYGMEQALQETPELLQTMIDKLLELSPVDLFCKTPEISEHLMDFLWEGIEQIAPRSDNIKHLLGKTRDMNVNIEASDSPMRGHFKVSNGHLSGGSAFFHFKDEDYRIMGSTKVLLELLLGELPLGFSNPEVQTAGHSGFAGFVSSVVKGVANVIKK